MELFIMIGVALVFDAVIIFACFMELLKVYSNPFPLFNEQKEKRIAEIIQSYDETENIKTRSILEDAKL